MLGIGYIIDGITFAVPNISYRGQQTSLRVAGAAISRAYHPGLVCSGQFLEFCFLELSAETDLHIFKGIAVIFPHLLGIQVE